MAAPGQAAQAMAAFAKQRTTRIAEVNGLTETVCGKLHMGVSLEGESVATFNCKIPKLCAYITLHVCAAGRGIHDGNEDV